MSYSYLLDLYQVLDDRLDQITEEQKNSSGNEQDQQFLIGRRDCLVEFKDFLQKNFHHKLPRRIQRTLRQDTNNT